jgi:hypothetical protein
VLVGFLEGLARLELLIGFCFLSYDAASFTLQGQAGAHLPNAVAKAWVEFESDT